MEQCIQYKLEQSSPDLWNSHLRTWAGLTWSFAKASKGPNMQLRATVAGRLLSLWIDYQREHHADRYHALSQKKEIEANMDEGTIGDAIAGIGIPCSARS